MHLFELNERMNDVMDLRLESDSPEVIAVYIRQAAELMLEYINTEEIYDCFESIVA